MALFELLQMFLDIIIVVDELIKLLLHCIYTWTLFAHTQSLISYLLYIRACNNIDPSQLIYASTTQTSKQFQHVDSQHQTTNSTIKTPASQSQSTSTTESQYTRLISQHISYRVIKHPPLNLRTSTTESEYTGLATKIP